MHVLASSSRDAPISHLSCSSAQLHFTVNLVPRLPDHPLGPAALVKSDMTRTIGLGHTGIRAHTLTQHGTTHPLALIHYLSLWRRMEATSLYI